MRKSETTFFRQPSGFYGRLSSKFKLVRFDNHKLRIHSNRWKKSILEGPREGNHSDFIIILNYLY